MIKFFRRKVTPTTKPAGFLLSLLLMLVSMPASAEDKPVITPFEAQYTAYKWGDDVGEVKIKLE